jgi:hypothetical protein
MDKTTVNDSNRALAHLVRLQAGLDRVSLRFVAKQKRGGKIARLQLCRNAAWYAFRVAKGSGLQQLASLRCKCGESNLRQDLLSET